jgi:hypothetical protein
MFSSLAGMPLSAYVRRRRMTHAAADLLGDEDLLSIAVRYGYGSTEAFGRAFRSVHGVKPGDARRDGGPLRTQSQLRFTLTVEGKRTMDTRIAERPAFRLVGHAARVPLIHRGINPHIQAHVASIPREEHDRLRILGNTQPAGLLQVSADVDPTTPKAATSPTCTGLPSPNRPAHPRISTPSRCRPGRGRCSGPKASTRLPCSPPGRPPPRTGSPPTRGVSVRALRSSRSSNGPTISAQPPASCGSLWSTPDRILTEHVALLTDRGVREDADTSSVLLLACGAAHSIRSAQSAPGGDLVHSLTAGNYSTPPAGMSGSNQLFPV